MSLKSVLRIQSSIIIAPPAAPATAVILRTPSGPIPQASWVPTFTWQGLELASYYLWTVQTAAGVNIFDAWLAYPSAFPEGNTDFQNIFYTSDNNSLINLAPGNYQWLLQDYGPSYGYGRWWGPRYFQIIGT